MKNTLRFLICLAAITASAIGADNTLGTWKLNTAKSNPAGSPSKLTSLTLVREASGNGVKVTAKGEREDKTKVDVSYVVKYDGKDTAISGSGLAYDTIAVTQVDANTLTDVRSKKGGMYKGTGRTVVSPDGKTLTLSTQGTGADGKPFSGTTVYEKQ